MPYLPVEFDCLPPQHKGDKCPHCDGTGKWKTTMHYRGRKKLTEGEIDIIKEVLLAVLGRDAQDGPAEIEEE